MPFDSIWFFTKIDVLPFGKNAGQTALHRAIHHGHFDIALLLLNYGASFEINDLKLKSPVQYCCKPKNYVHEQSQIKEQSVLMLKLFIDHLRVMIKMDSSLILITRI